MDEYEDNEGSERLIDMIIMALEEILEAKIFIKGEYCSQVCLTYNALEYPAETVVGLCNNTIGKLKKIDDSVVVYHMHKLRDRYTRAESDREMQMDIIKEEKTRPTFVVIDNVNGRILISNRRV